MIDGHAAFTEGCVAAFAMLVERYGCIGPEIEPIGREIFVAYHKGDHTVSVAYEPGFAPIVELFYPAAETGERPLLWAERNGVSACRRIPRLNVGEAFSEDEAAGFHLYLRASAHALERVERDWLAG